MPEACGVEDPTRPGVTCTKRPGQHPSHTDGQIGWPDLQVRQRVTIEAINRPGISDKDARKSLEELANMAKPPSHFVRTDDPPNSHEAIQRYEPQRNTAKGRVLFYLREHRGEWVDAPVFHQPEIGGFAGTRRLRELREAGWPIQTRPKPEDTNTWQHRLIEEE